MLARGLDAAFTRPLYRGPQGIHIGRALGVPQAARHSFAGVHADHKSDFESKASDGILRDRQGRRARFFILEYENDRYGEFT